jgi:hypothetical protein
MDKLEIKRALLYNKPRLLWDYADKIKGAISETF